MNQIDMRLLSDYANIAKQLKEYETFVKPYDHAAKYYEALMAPYAQAFEQVRQLENHLTPSLNYVKEFGTYKTFAKHYARYAPTVEYFKHTIDDSLLKGLDTSGVTFTQEDLDDLLSGRALRNKVVHDPLESHPADVRRMEVHDISKPVEEARAVKESAGTIEAVKTSCSNAADGEGAGSKSAVSNVQSVTLPPAVGMLRLGRLLLTKKAYQGVLEPTVSDMRTEYFDALSAGDQALARAILIRGRWDILKVIFMSLPSGWLKKWMVG